MTWRPTFWQIALAVIVILAIPTALFHFTHGLYAQAVEAAGAGILGVVLLVADWLRRPSEAQRAAAEREMVAARASTSHPTVGEVAHQYTARIEPVDRIDWLQRSVLAGFAATAVMAGLLAFVYGLIASFASNSPTASTFARWSWALTHNTLTVQANADLPGAAIGFFLMGIVWALVYGDLVQGRLPGPGWEQGMIFSLVPWILSMVVFLPLFGGGLLGFGLGAGPLPLIGNLILHLIYGATLGEVYAGRSNVTLAEPQEDGLAWERGAFRRDEADTAVGIVIGLIVGGLLGWVVAIAIGAGASAGLGVMVGLLLGSAVGALVGSVVGLTPTRY